MRLVLIVFSIILSFNSYAQKEKDSLLMIWNNVKLVDSVRANTYKYYINEYYLGSKIDSAYAMTLELMDFIEKRKLIKQKADASILLSNIESVFGNDANATLNLKESLSIYKELNNKRGIAAALHGIGVSYRKVFNLDEAKIYFEKALKISEEINDTLLISSGFINLGNIYLWRYKNDTAIAYYRKSLELSIATKNKYQEALATINIASVYNQKSEFSLAEKEISKAIKIGEYLDNYVVLSGAYSILSNTYLRQKLYDKLIITANKSLGYAEKISLYKDIDGAYYFLFQAYKGKRNFDNTIKYYELRKSRRTTIEDITSTALLERMKIDNTRAKDSLISVNKTLKAEMAYQQEKSNLTLAWGGSLSTLSILALIVYRNTKRKQRKAEKERQQQIEEKEKILKDLELSTIDAMIQGQEKERQRLAEDLHDSVGATLSAAKLQFDFLIKNKNDAKYSEELIKKMSTLLEDAYVEVRSMAHLKNAGVIAKNGLLPAVKKLSSNASGANGLTVEVQSFGLENRLENTLEISIFRIIQELVTNIIKHANATTGTIHLTNHDHILNIMVEDNGIGFNPKQIMKTNAGMGISSIDKRVAHLDGTLTIESEKNKGTTVIIDIPV